MTAMSTKERYLGNYRLLHLLGRGGQALVYLGEHRYLKRLAAIKVLRTELDEKKEQRFRTEARLLASLSHPHIVRVLEFGIEQGTPFLVMDYASKGSLLTLFPRGSRLALDQVLNYTTQIASALHYAHNRHIIHRDIKQENLLLNEQQQLMISDFGLALLAPASGEPVSTQGMEGTLPYMAPEQLCGKPGYATDQYALAIMTYEWLCGSRPFTGTLPEVIHQHCFISPPALREKNPAIPEAVEAVILKALEKEPAARYPDIQSFAKALVQASLTAQKQVEPPTIKQSTSAMDQPTGGALPASLPPSDATGALRLRLPMRDEPKKVITASIPAVKPPISFPEETPVYPDAFTNHQRWHGAPAEANAALRHPDEYAEIVPTPVLQPALAAGRSQEVHNAKRPQITPSPERTTAANSPLASGNRNRQLMLHRVRSIWISDFFEQALSERALITPRLVAYPDAVARPWTTLLRQAQPSFQPFPAKTRIIEVYDQVDGGMLILGGPGSGKTMLALELVRDLLERAEQDESQPMPVVFNLSSWSQERLSLVEWLVAELTSKYQVPHRLAQRWIESHALLPVLDGLDEVGKEQLSACIQAINAYLQGTGALDNPSSYLQGTGALDNPSSYLQGTGAMEKPASYREEYRQQSLVVCGRSEEYFAQEERMLLRSAIVVQPLTMQQVDDYLEHAKGNFAVLRKALRADPALRELATTPLLLSTMLSAYRDRPLGELLTAASTQERQQQIFATYVEQALTRHQPGTTYRPQQTIGWLSGLARQMLQHNQSVFYLEQMQPDWIKERLWSQVYAWLAVRLPGLLIGLLCGIIVNNLLYHNGSPSLFRLQMLIGGLIGFLLSDRALQADHEGSRKVHRAGWKQLLAPGHLINALLMGLISWFVLGSAYHRLGGLVLGFTTLLLSIALALPEKRASGIPPKPSRLHSIMKRFGAAFGGSTPMRPNTSLSGRVHFSAYLNARNHKRSRTVVQMDVWRKHINNGILLGGVYAVGDRFIEGINQGWLVGLSVIARDGMRYGLLAVLLSVLLLSDQGSVYPSEIIAWSWQRCWRFLCQREHVRSSLRVLLSIGLVYGISYGLSNWLGEGFANGLGFGISYALIVALCYWLIPGIFQGLSSESIDNRQRIKPNEGIRRSIRNMFIIAIIAICLSIPFYIASNTLYMGLKDGVRTTLTTWFRSSTSPSARISTVASQGVSLAKQAKPKQAKQKSSNQAQKNNAGADFIAGAARGWQIGLANSWIAGLVTALLVALLGGGLACLRHGLLRLLLWRMQAFPPQAPHFLDYAAERVLLRKIGGGYIFLHPLLLNYFAALPSQQPPRRDSTTRLALSAPEKGYAVDGQTKLVRLL